MAALRCVRSCMFIQRRFPRILKTLNNKGRCIHSRRERAFKQELYSRRIKAGPEAERHPSAYGIWSYESEIFAFGKRLGEDFDEVLLKQAFTQKSYAVQEEEKRRELGIEDPLFQIKYNETLVKTGQEVASVYIKSFLRYAYPHMFEECISDLHDYLMSGETLWYIGTNLGLKDLIVSAEYPPPDDDYPCTLLAVVGALAESQGKERAGSFVKDFILAHLIGKDINSLWELYNPMGALVAILKAQGRQPPEPRLLWKSGSGTIMSVYHVGLYSNKQLLGRSPGETPEIAEEMAARDAIARIMGTDGSRSPLPITENVTVDYSKVNTSLNYLLKSQSPTKQINR